VILFGVAIWVGLSFARPAGLGLPLLEARLQGKQISEDLRRILPISVILGVILALLIIALDIFVFQPVLVAQFSGTAFAADQPALKPAAWKGFLASFYGGINEEILLRLCVMSFLVWLGRFVSKTPDGRPTLAVIWIANILAAVLFGLGHLPATAAAVPLTPLIVARAIVLNGIGGVGFGYLYSKHGLESAMISHFSADIVLHVLFAI
jgi:membrane protease YdiL (CAAX protease family)